MGRHAIAIGLVLLVAACGDGGSGADDGAGTTGPAATTQATTGVLAGRAVFEGQAPAPRTIAVNKDPEHCGAAAGEVQDVVVSGTGGLAGVIVEIQGYEGHLDAGGEYVVRQKGCMFEPHVLVVPNKAELTIYNDDPVSHNVNSGRWNFQQNAGDGPIRKSITFQGRSFVRVNCNIHSWMEMWVYVARSPHLATTDADGNFRIEGVPPGSYKATASHPTLGSKRLKITIEAGQTTTEDITFK